MTTISVSKDTKRRFDEVQPDDLTHDEFVAELLNGYQGPDTQQSQEVPIDVDEIVDEITKRTATHIEMAAYRGTADAIENTPLEL